MRIYCGTGISNENDVHYRYKIVAVDKHLSESVPSDFVYIKAHPILPDRPINPETEQPLVFSLRQNYPNPFNPSTEISYSIPNNSFVTLKIYNSIGQLVEELVNNEFKNAGHYSINFDGSNLASGIYFYSLEAGNFKNVMKMVLLK